MDAADIPGPRTDLINLGFLDQLIPWNPETIALTQATKQELRY